MVTVLISSNKATAPIHMSHQRTTSATIPYTPPPMIQRALQGAHSAVLQSNFKATAAVTVIYMHFYCCCCDSHCFILLVVIFVVIAAVGTYNIPSQHKRYPQMLSREVPVTYVLARQLNSLRAQHFYFIWVHILTTS